MRWLLLLLACPVFGQERIVESIIPALAFGPQCSSVLDLRNLSDRGVMVDVEGHRASGALVSLAGRSGTTIRMAAHEHGNYKLEISEQTNGAWARIREHIPAAGLSPALAVSAATECVVANQLRTVTRDVAFPMRNPWFSSDVAELNEGLISLINTAESPVQASLCYSSGSHYSLPNARGGADWKPICATAFDVQIPPFGSREFPVSRGGSSHLQLKTAGESIVLELLRPLEEHIRVYVVDSSIRFSEELKP